MDQAAHRRKLDVALEQIELDYGGLLMRLRGISLVGWAPPGVYGHAPGALQR
jgi:hypothetical protein